ncbi:MAG: peptide chain release factor N(5)-glutamine methyltransferase [Azonexus sp.]|nr:peptide chain release factor N(5)-glutamine methyltransferase [Betaproteobacteria bacterium]MBK8919189.1 peptide chain release factor N(5)-glutamine methyltransferase [Betaproteobacteria bacterium]MBP6037467.1 peptide chain release factor N(5)-glutamine methyltransferase [Azonexus sp.]MBP6908062.1 peptide chain release factor N(5)-glutamine methyltransferase [Azonexus sp.]
MILTRGAAWRRAAELIDRLDARLIVQHAAACSHADLIARPEKVLTEDQGVWLDSLVARRQAGEPLAYLLGRAGFFGREFAVTPAVLIPRPETEGLVERALKTLVGMAEPHILDLGTGSGVIAVTLALERPGARVVAVDLSPEALVVAADNAAALGAAVDFRAGDWYGPLPGERFDLVVANPPYIEFDDPHLDHDGLPFEPQGALTDGVAGGDGLAAVRTVVRGAPAHLRPGGWLWFEHGHDQGAACRNLLRGAGFKDVLTQTDLAGSERISGGQI